MSVKLGAFYVDAIEELNLVGTPLLIANLWPAPNATDVPSSDEAIPFGTASHPIYLTVFDTTANGLNTVIGTPHTVITVTTVEDGPVVVWDGSNWGAGWSTYSTWTPVSSDGVVGADEHRFVLIRDTPFSSLDEITVQVDAENLDNDTEQLIYSFTVEDLTDPVVMEVGTRTLRRVRITFDEPMDATSGARGDVTYVRDVSGGIKIAPRNGITPPRIIAPSDVFTSEMAGLYVGVANADQAVNNGYFNIVSVIDARTLEIDNEAALEEQLPTDHIVTVSPYLIQGVPDPKRLIPFFNPIVIGAETVLSGADVIGVELLLHDSITQNREYSLNIKHVNDVWGNALTDMAYPFTSERCPVPQERLDEEFDWLNLIPVANLEQDQTGDLERLLRCLDEVMQLLLCDVDKFADMADIDLIDATNLDAMLVSLGAPFSFTASLSETDKRRLAAILVDAYKRKGLESGMEALISYLLAVDVDIRPYTSDPDRWVLGDSKIGEDTYLGPGTQFLLYAFEAESPDTLTEQQRRRIIEVIDYMKPAHTHLVRLIEP